MYHKRKVTWFSYCLMLFKGLLKGKVMKSRLYRGVVVAGLVLSSMVAHAATEWTWVLNSSPTGTDLPLPVSVMGYSAANNSTNLVATSGVGLPDMTWYSGGYGICSPSPGDPTCSSPNHAMDNNSAYESIALGFGTAVTLETMKIGWSSTDSDMSVLAYTGSGTPTPLTSLTYGNLLSNGWSLVGQYSNVVANNNTLLNTTISSSYWLIAAYNSVFQNEGWTTGNDYVKLYAVAGNTANPPPPGRVSEPTALLLMGTALFGIVGLRRRQSAN
jgi:hypothetical protein